MPANTTSPVFDPFDPATAPQADGGVFDPFAPENAEVNEPGFVTTVKNTIGQQASTLGRALQDVPGVRDTALPKKLGGWGADVQARNPTAIHSLADIAAAPVQTVQEGLANAAGQAPAMIAGGGAGRLIGGLIGARFGPGGAALGQKIGSYVGAAAPTLAQEYGGIRQQQDETGIDDKARALTAAVPATAVEFGMGPQRFLGKVIGEGFEGSAKQLARKLAQETAGKSAAEVGRHVLKSAGKAIGRNALEEGTEELVQNPIEAWGAHQDPTSPEAIDQALTGFFLGGAGGAGLGAPLVGIQHAKAKGMLDRGEAAPNAAPNAAPSAPNAVVPPESPVLPGSIAAPNAAPNAAPSAPPPSGPLGRAAAAGAAMASATAPAPMQDTAGTLDDPAAFQQRLEGMRGLVEDKEFLRSLRRDSRFGDDVVTDLLHAWSVARNPQLEAAVRDYALASAELLLHPPQKTNAPDLWGPGAPAPEVLPSSDAPIAGGAASQQGMPGGVEGPTAPVARPDKVMPESVAAPEDPAIARRRALEAESRLAEIGGQIEANRAKESAAKRRALLEGILADPTTQNPLERFQASLKRAGFTDARPTEDEARAIERYGQVREALEAPAPVEIEPSTPNELDAAAMGIREKGAPRQPRRDFSRTHALVDQGYTQVNRTDAGHTLTNPATGETVPVSPAEAQVARVRGQRAKQAAIDAAAHAAATSPKNDLPEPTDDQKKAGNYRKGDPINFHGLTVRVENPKGSQRWGVDPEGVPWSVVMPAHYGDIKRTEAADGDNHDITLGEYPDAKSVFVIDQVDDKTGEFDEHKTFGNVRSRAEAEALYDASFSDGKGPQRRAAITEMTIPAFKQWLKDGDTTLPVSRESFDPTGKLIRPAPESSTSAAPETPPAQDVTTQTDETGAPAPEVAQTRAPTVDMMQQAIAKVGDRRFRQLVADHLSGLDEELSPEEEAAEIEGVARLVMEGAFDDAPAEPAPPSPPSAEPSAETVTEPAKSAGHIAFKDGFEYYRVGTDLHRAPIDSPVMPDGSRSGRFEATEQATPQALKLAGIVVEKTGKGLTSPVLPTSDKARSVADLLTKNGFHGDVYDLAGDRKKEARRDVMSALLNRRATIAESGVTALRTELYKLAGVKGDHEAARMRALSEWVTQHAAPQNDESAVTRLMGEVRRYASGLSRLGDLVAGSNATGGADLRGVGADVGELSENGIKQLAQAIVVKNVAAFIDSGAFSAFRRGLRSGEFTPLDFDAIMSRYDALEIAIGDVAEENGEITDHPRPLLVMPDVVGDQAESLRLVEKYRNWIRAELTSGNLSRPVIPIQRGDLTLEQAYRKIVDTLGTDNFIVGIPSNEQAASPEEVTNFLRAAKPKAIHILGAAADKTLRPRLQSVIDAGLADRIYITADASPIRSKIIQAVQGGIGRAEAIGEHLGNGPDSVTTDAAAERARELVRTPLGELPSAPKNAESPAAPPVTESQVPDTAQALETGNAGVATGQEDGRPQVVVQVRDAHGHPYYVSKAELDDKSRTELRLYGIAGNLLSNSGTIGRDGIVVVAEKSAKPDTELAKPETTPDEAEPDYRFVDYGSTAGIKAITEFKDVTLDALPGVEFFANKTRDGKGWVITHRATGRSILPAGASEATVEDAVQAGNKRFAEVISNKGMALTLEILAKAKPITTAQKIAVINAIEKQKERAAAEARGERLNDDDDHPIFKEGERVEIVSDPYAGTHGVIVEATPITMQAIFGGGGRKTSYHYKVRADTGRMLYPGAGTIQPETSPAPQVTPDPLLPNKRHIAPDELLSDIQRAKNAARDSRVKQANARKPEKKAEWGNNAKGHDARAIELQYLWDDWAEKYPEEAAKYLPKKAEAPAPAAAPKAAPSESAGEAPLHIAPYGDRYIVVRGQTRENKDRIKAIRGAFWNRKAEGWTFFKDREADVRTALADLLGDSPVEAYAKEHGAKLIGKQNYTSADIYEMPDGRRFTWSHTGKPLFDDKNARHLTSAEENTKPDVPAEAGWQLLQGSMSPGAAANLFEDMGPGRRVRKEGRLGVLDHPVVDRKDPIKSARDLVRVVWDDHVTQLVDGRTLEFIPHSGYGERWDAMSYSEREKIAESVWGGMRAVVHRVAGSNWQQLLDGHEAASIETAMKQGVETAPAGGMTLLEARNALIEVRNRIAGQGRVVEDRLLTRKNQLLAIIKELEAEAPPTEKTTPEPPAAPPTLETPTQARFGHGDVPGSAERELLEMSHADERPGDVMLMNSRFAPFDEVVARAREGIEAGAIRPVPAQLHFKIGLAMRDVDRVLAASTAPAKAPEKGWTLRGKNEIGQTLYQDERGVRSYIENGVRITEPVALRPTRQGMQVSVEDREDTFRTVAEIRSRQIAEANKDLPEGYEIRMELASDFAAGARDEPVVSVFKNGERTEDKGLSYTQNGIEEAARITKFRAEKKISDRFTIEPAAQEGYLLVKDGSNQSLARFKIKDGKAVSIEHFFESPQTRTPVLEAIQRAVDTAAIVERDAAKQAPPTKTGPAEAAQLPANWTREDVQYLRDMVAKGDMVLLSEKWASDAGLPTIHTAFPKESAKHIGFGMFDVNTPEYDATFEGGGSMQSTPGGRKFTTIGVSRGTYPYPKEAVLATFDALLEPKAAPEQPTKTGAELLNDRIKADIAKKAATPEAAPGYGSTNTVFTADAAAKARELLKKKLGTLNAGIDPELLQAGITLAGYHVEAGARTFAAYTKAMVADLGDAVRPYLKSFYNALRDYPGFDAKGLTPYEEASKADVSAPPAPATPDEEARFKAAVDEIEAELMKDDWLTTVLQNESNSPDLLGLAIKKQYEDAMLAYGERTQWSDAKVFDRLARDANTPSAMEALAVRVKARVKASLEGGPTPEQVDAAEQRVEDILLQNEYLRAWARKDDFKRGSATEFAGFVPHVVQSYANAATELNNQGELDPAVYQALVDYAKNATLMEAFAERLAALYRAEQSKPTDGTYNPDQEGAGDEQGGLSGTDSQGDRGERDAAPADTGAGRTGGRGGDRDAAGGLREGHRGDNLPAANGEPEVPSGGDAGAARDDGARDGRRGGDRAGNGVRRGERRGVNYSAPPGALTREGSWLDTARRNIDIIELTKRLEAEGREATPDEQTLLAKYTGFGAVDIRQKLFPVSSQTKELQPNWAEGPWRVELDRLLKLVTPEELKTLLQSTQYAHYTSEPITRSIWSALERMGFHGGKMVEPGMGSGNFPITAPKALLDASRYTGIEFDGVTARIAHYLLPRESVIHQDFKQQKLPTDFFDVAVGNPPFLKLTVLTDPAYKKYRFSLHDYFLAKTLDAVRPGGLLVVVTGRYTMDKGRDRARQYIAERADLLGAIRLPQTAFKQNAGTEVVTDVLFLRKRYPGAAPAGPAWLGQQNVSGLNKKGETHEALINEYFANHPEMVLGRHSFQGTMYGPNEYTVEPATESTIEAQFAAAVERLPADVYTPKVETKNEAARPPIERDFNPKSKKEGGLYVSDKGEVMRVESGSGVPLSALTVERAQDDGASKTAPVYSDKDLIWLRDYVGLRDAVKQAMADQLHDGPWEKSLAAANKAYRALVKKHGQLLEHTTSEREKVDEDTGEVKTTIMRRFAHAKRLRADVEAPLVEALERITDDDRVVLGPFLQGRTIKKPETPKIESARDALAVSLGQIGRLDLDHVAELAGRSRAETLEELGDGVFLNPNGERWETADEYLSGKVVDKLDAAIAAAATDERYQRNVEALSSVQPTPLAASNITVEMGQRWIPVEVVNGFASEVLGLTGNVVSYNDATRDWSVPGEGSRKARKPGAWSNADRSTVEIVEAVLNNRIITIKRTADNKEYTDSAATAAVDDIMKRMRAAFSAWIWTDAERAGTLTALYNRRFNDVAPRRFDGAHLSLPGLSLNYKLHPHQKRAIWRVIQTGDTYLAHAVGAGKTLEMIVSGMEQKRLGLINKPMYVVPNHMLKQFSSEFLQAYPTASIMVADEENFHTTNRKRFIAQAALNNPDAIIVTHSSFKLLSMKRENMQPVLDEMLAELDAMLDEVKDDRVSRSKVEGQIERITEKFLSRASTAGTDKVVDFEDLGVDFVYFDEAHAARKLDYATNMLNVKGIDANGSQLALKLLMATRWLGTQRPGRSHVFASGTPITNTMAELYSLLRFMDPESLAQDGLDTFDAWAKQYGKVSTMPERNAAGKYEMVTRFAKFMNIPELMSRVRNRTDILTSSQLGTLVVRPDVIGGGPANVVVDASEALVDYMEKELGPRIEISRAWKPTPQQPGNPDPLLAIISDARLAVIDMRFVKPRMKDDPGSKLNRMLTEIIAEHERIKDLEFLDENGKVEPIKGGTQIVFSAVGFGEQASKNRGFDLRKVVMARLEAGGLKRAEIAWISDYTSHAKKERLFADMRAGKVRVLIGSPASMGTGLNVQNRLAALHYLSPPWYPADVEQPHGRILRQGNKNKEVVIKWYATNGTYDSTQWGMVARKARFIEQALVGDPSVRVLEDISEASQYEMAAALAAGDQRVIQMAGLQSDLERLNRLEEAHAREQIDLQQSKRAAEYRIETATKHLASLQAAYAAAGPLSSYEGWKRLRLDGKAFDAKAFGGSQRDARAALDDAMAERVMSAVRGWQAKGLDDTSEVEIATFADNGAKVVLKLAVEQNKKDAWVRGRLVTRAGPITDAIHTNILIDSVLDGKDLVANAVSNVSDLPSDIRGVESEIERVKGELKQTISRIGIPFPYGQELNEKTAELAQLQRELAPPPEVPTPPAPPVAPDAPEVGDNAVEEPAADYHGGHDYTHDLGGNPLSEVLPALSVRDPAGQPARRVATNRNLLAASVVPGARYATVVSPTQTGTLKVAHGEVRSAVDAASALASLRKSPQERFFVLVLDAKRRPIAVLRLFAGGTNATSVYPDIVTKAVYELPGAAHIWYAHNHPSTIPTPSRADEMLTRILSGAFGAGTGVTVDGHIIIGGTQATELDADGTPIGGILDIKPVARTQSVPILERTVRKAGRLGGAMSAPEASIREIPKIAEGRTGVVFLDGQNYPVAFLPFTLDQMKKLRDDGAPSGARILFGAAARSNAAGAIAYLGENPRQKTAAAVANLYAALHENRDIRVLDAIHNGTSMAQSGLIQSSGTGTFASVGTGARTRETPATIRAAIVARFGEAPIKALEDGGVLRIVGSASALPAGLLREGDADAIYDPRNRVAYLIADRLTRDLAPAKLLHEIGAHYGLKTLLGDRGWQALAGKVRTLARVEGSRAQGIWSAIKESYKEFNGLDDAELARNERFIEEMIAHLGESEAFRKTSIWRDLVAAIKRFLVQLGFAGTITEADVGALLAGSLQEAARVEAANMNRYERDMNAAQASVAQTETPAFKRWFGDSKVVDAEGRPLVVYHATTGNFDAFKPGGNNPELSGPAIWMTPNKENQPAAHNTRLVPGEKNKVYGLSSGKFTPGTNVMPLYATISNPFITTEGTWKKDFEKVGGGSPWVLSAKEVGAIAASGHDGILYYDKNGTLSEVVAFHPEQIKSAVGNTGEFSPQNPSILRSIEQTTTPAFKRWFGTSKVVDADGDPLVVYRGEHGPGKEGDIEHAAGSISFGSKQAANTYAQHPNNWRDVAVSPRVIPAYLRIENPIVNDPEDPFIDITTIEKALGREEALRIADKFSDDIEYTSNWMEDFSGTYESVQDLINRRPDLLSELYFDAYKLLDDREEVAKLVAAGFDGAIHAGNGETAMEAEYKVFDKSQIKSAIGNTGEFNPDNPGILHSVAQTATPAFKRWFEGSRVVDAKGRPLVLYHGTDQDFDAFERTDDIGFHFGTREAAADRLEAYGTHGHPPKHVMPVYLRIRNPLRLPDLGMWEPENVAVALVKAGIIDQKTADRTEIVDREQVREWLAAKGYDAIVYANTVEGSRAVKRVPDDIEEQPSTMYKGGVRLLSSRYGLLADMPTRERAYEKLKTRIKVGAVLDHSDSYIVFDPEQIKSAIGNTGEFNPENPSILRSIEQTKTPAFERWFAGSKIVDAEGRPLVVYHGTQRAPDGIDQFGKGASTYYGKRSASKPVTWFTSDPDKASIYANWVKGAGNSTVYPVYVSLKNPATLDDVYAITTEEPEISLYDTKVVKKLKAAGFDGVVWRNSEYYDDARTDGHDAMTVVAFHPEQVKSAVGNTGEFNPDNPSIMRSEPGPVWYSELARQVDRAPMKRGPAGAWMQYINALKTKGVKPDEIAWSGIEDWLKLQPSKVDKEQVSEFLRANGVKVEEVELGRRAGAERSKPRSMTPAGQCPSTWTERRPINPPTART
jgi:N12 class adenine-specific DNA methylase